MKKYIVALLVVLGACTSRFPKFELEQSPSQTDPKRSAMVTMSWEMNGKEIYTSWVKDNDNQLNFQYLTGPRVSFIQGIFNMTPDINEATPRTTKIEP